MNFFFSPWSSVISAKLTDEFYKNLKLYGLCCQTEDVLDIDTFDEDRLFRESGDDVHFEVILPENKAPCPFGDDFFEHLLPYSPASEIKENVSDLECGSPPSKRHVYIVEDGLDMVEHSGCSRFREDSPNASRFLENTCSSTTSRGLSQETTNPLSIISQEQTNNFENVRSTEPRQNLLNTEIVNLKTKNKRKRKRKQKLPKCTSTSLFLSTPPWFLIPESACYVCKQYMKGGNAVHLKHRPIDPLFPSTPLFNQENARKWADLFNSLIVATKTHFKAISDSNLLEILGNKIPQEPNTTWSEPQLHALRTYHSMYSNDDVQAKDIVFNPPNSIKVLANGKYFLKVMEQGGPDYKRDINRI